MDPTGNLLTRQFSGDVIHQLRIRGAGIELLFVEKWTVKNHNQMRCFLDSRSIVIHVLAKKYLPLFSDTVTFAGTKS